MPLAHRRRPAARSATSTLNDDDRPNLVAVRHISVVARWQKQVPAATALVGSGYHHVHDPALMMIVDQPDVGTGGQLDHHRAVEEVERADAIRRVRVEREADLTRARRSDPDLLVVCQAGLTVAVEDSLETDTVGYHNR